MATLKQRHAEARAGINLIKSLGVNPRDIQPYLYQRFLRNGFDPRELPIFKTYNVSFQLNYDNPKDKKNNKFKLDSAQTYKVYTRLDYGMEKLSDGFDEVINDYFGHKSLTKDLKVQGLESDDLVFDWNLVSKVTTEGFYIENNDNVKFDLQFFKGESKIGRKYTEEVNLHNYI